MADSSTTQKDKDAKRFDYKQFDYTGLKCPLPVLKTRRALKQMSEGETALFMADDPAAPLDFEHFCETSGHLLKDTRQENDVFLFLIEKGR